MNFNLTIIRPQGFLHSSAFIEIRDSVGWALAELGHVANNSENFLSTKPEDTNIIFGAELLSQNQSLPKNTIIYNLEQPTHPNMDKVYRIARTQGIRMWSCFIDGDSTHVPVGYTPNLTRIPDCTHYEDSWDVLFYGWMTPRRQEIVKRLRDAGLKVYASDALYGGGRDSLISRAKIVLNVHHDGRDLFEIVRVSYLMANAKCVVSETSRDDEQYADLHRGFIRAPYEQIVDRCKELVSNKRQVVHDCRFMDMPRVALETIRKRDMVSYIRHALNPAVTADCDDLWNKPQAKVMRRYQEALKSGDMKDFATRLKDLAHGQILEIGVRDGASTAAFLAGLEEHDRDGHLYSIDIADCGKLFAGHPQWTFYQMDSKEFFSRPRAVEGRGYDVILIDGDHSREGFRADLEGAWEILASGGTILCHDIVTKPSWTLEEKPGSDLPSKFIRDEYFSFCERIGCPHAEVEEWPGLGIIFKTLDQRPTANGEHSESIPDSGNDAVAVPGDAHRAGSEVPVSS